MSPHDGEFSFDPTSADFVRDPYPIYEFLRREDPIHRMSNGFWVFTRYADIAAALKDRGFSNAPHPFSIVGPQNRERHPAARVAGQLMAFKDSPGHESLRKPFAASFKTQMSRSKAVVREITEAQFASQPRKTAFDFLSQVANPVASQVICKFLGLPPGQTEALTEWSRLFFYLFHAIPNATVLEQVNKAILEFEAFVRAQYHRKRAEPGDDLLSLMVDHEELSEDEVVHNVMLIAADGIGNVDVGLAVALATLLRFPDELERLRAEPGLIRSAIAECLRYDSPAQYQGRILLEGAEIGGKTLPPRSIVLLALASGNRDQRQAPDADVFRIDRKGFRHLSFGLGGHACLGMALVLLQFETVLEVILENNIRMSPEPEPIHWQSRAGHRWPETLSVKIE